MKAPFAAAIAISIGLLVLTGTFLAPGMDTVLAALLQLALIIGAMAVLIGIFNLLKVHWMRVKGREKRSVYSFAVIAAFLMTLLAGVLLGPNTPHFSRVVTNIQYPIESSLMGLTAVSLAFSSLTLIRRKHRSLFVYAFTIASLLSLLTLLGFFETVSSPAVDLILKVFQAIPVGGVRGLLVGMAIGMLVTGIRIITGADRPYAG